MKGVNKTKRQNKTRGNSHANAPQGGAGAFKAVAVITVVNTINPTTNAAINAVSANAMSASAVKNSEVKATSTKAGASGAP